ncbi:hypothetical protein chiPu_0029194, partial [Chiloscyllium punctatum]|nr:hypothetical protein [Chiloscyllium punctatum]
DGLGSRGLPDSPSECWGSGPSARALGGQALAGALEDEELEEGDGEEAGEPGNGNAAWREAWGPGPGSG